MSLDKEVSNVQWQPEQDNNDASDSGNIGDHNHNMLNPSSFNSNELVKNQSSFGSDSVQNMNSSEESSSFNKITNNSSQEQLGRINNKANNGNNINGTQNGNNDCASNADTVVTSDSGSGSKNSNSARTYVQQNKSGNGTSWSFENNDAFLQNNKRLNMPSNSANPQQLMDPCFNSNSREMLNFNIRNPSVNYSVAQTNMPLNELSPDADYYRNQYNQFDTVPVQEKEKLNAQNAEYCNLKIANSNNVYKDPNAIYHRFNENESIARPQNIQQLSQSNQVLHNKNNKIPNRDPNANYLSIYPDNYCQQSFPKPLHEVPQMHQFAGKTCETMQYPPNSNSVTIGKPSAACRTLNNSYNPTIINNRRVDPAQMQAMQMGRPNLANQRNAASYPVTVQHEFNNANMQMPVKMPQAFANQTNGSYINTPKYLAYNNAQNPNNQMNRFRRCADSNSALPMNDVMNLDAQANMNSLPNLVKLDNINPDHPTEYSPSSMPLDNSLHYNRYLAENANKIAPKQNVYKTNQHELAMNYNKQETPPTANPMPNNDMYNHKFPNKYERSHTDPPDNQYMYNNYIEPCGNDMFCNQRNIMRNNRDVSPMSCDPRELVANQAVYNNCPPRYNSNNNNCTTVNDMKQLQMNKNMNFMPGYTQQMFKQNYPMTNYRVNGEATSPNDQILKYNYNDPAFLKQNQEYYNEDLNMLYKNMHNQPHEIVNQNQNRLFNCTNELMHEAYQHPMGHKLFNNPNMLAHKTPNMVNGTFSPVVAQSNIKAQPKNYEKTNTEEETQEKPPSIRQTSAKTFYDLVLKR